MDSEDDYDGGVVLAGAEGLDFSSTDAKPPAAAAAATSMADKRKRKREREKLNKRKSKKSEDDETAPQVSKDRSKKKGAGKGRWEGKSAATTTDAAPGGEAEPVNEDMAMMDPKLLADYVAQRLRRFQKDLSSVELEDRYISGWLALVYSRIHTHIYTARARAMGLLLNFSWYYRICVFGYYVIHLSQDAAESPSVSGILFVPLLPSCDFL